MTVGGDGGLRPHATLWASHLLAKPTGTVRNPD